MQEVELVGVAAVGAKVGMEVEAVMAAVVATVEVEEMQWHREAAKEGAATATGYSAAEGCWHMTSLCMSTAPPMSTGQSLKPSCTGP